MSLKIDRFEVIDVDNRGTEKVGIKDHSTDKIVVLLNMFDKKEDNVSLAESIILAIEDVLTASDNNGGED